MTSKKHKKKFAERIAEFERKQVEGEMAHLSSFPRLNPNPIIEVDLAGNICYLNAAAKTLLDGRGSASPHTCLADFDSLVDTFKKNPDPVRREIQLGESWYEQIVTYVEGVQRIRFYCLDITERKRAEDALRESERQMARAQEIAHLGSWELDVVKNHLTWSDEVYRIFGLKPQEFRATYEAFLEAVHPDDRAAVDAAYLGSLSEGTDMYEIEHRIVVKATGEVRTVHEKCEHIRDASGRIICSTGMVHDITERKHADLALKEARDELEDLVKERTVELNHSYEEVQREIEQRKNVERGLRNLTAALEQAVEGVFVNDADGVIVYANTAFHHMLGYDDGELLGRRIWETRGDDRIHRSDEVETALKSAKVWRGVIPRRRKDGVVIQTETSVGPIRDEIGAIVNYVGVSRDITEQLQLEEQLRQAHKMQAMGTLAGGIAHDFNNILAAIIGFIEMSLDDVADKPDTQHKLGRVLKASLRGRDLVKQILAFSRKAESTRQEISLTSLVRETHALLRSSLPSTIHMRLAIKTDDECVLADPTQIQQVLMNLASNAADAMREEGGHLTVTLSSVTFTQDIVLPDPDMLPRTYLKLTVKDSGCGMTEEVRQRIFEPFFTTKLKAEGTGMGLAVAYGIVKNHGGVITVHSEPGKGSIFEVYLPREETSGPDGNEAESSASPHGAERILFVDDEELIVEMGKGMLESLGYTVTVARHPVDALNLFRTNPSQFDLVITDQTMPDMTGLTLAGKMLKLRKKMPIVLCTGHSETASPEKARELGIAAFAMKPLMKKELAETIRQVLGRKNT